MTSRSLRAHSGIGGTRETNALCVAVTVVACSTTWEGLCARSRLLRRSLSQSTPRASPPASGQLLTSQSVSQNGSTLPRSQLATSCPLNSAFSLFVRPKHSVLWCIGCLWKCPLNISWHRLASWLCHRRTMESSRVINGHRPPQRNERQFILIFGHVAVWCVWHGQIKNIKTLNDVGFW